MKLKKEFLGASLEELRDGTSFIINHDSVSKMMAEYAIELREELGIEGDVPNFCCADINYIVDRSERYIGYNYISRGLARYIISLHRLYERINPTQEAVTTPKKASVVIIEW